MTVVATSDILDEINRKKQAVCPLLSDNTCRVSPNITLDIARLIRFCSCEDYEDCAIFLAKRLNGRV